VPLSAGKQAVIMTDDQVNSIVQHLCQHLHLTIRLKGSKAHPPNAKDIGFDGAAVNTVLRTALKLAGISIYSITESNGDERRGAMVLAKARDPSPA
jgi:hypothetical protein